MTALGRNNVRYRHGAHGTPEYVAFVGARHRCNVPKSKSYPRYGGRGILFLFTSFEQWFAVLGPRPSPQHSVDRFPNNDGNYEPGNVRWATRSEQDQNKRRPALNVRDAATGRWLSV